MQAEAKAEVAPARNKNKPLESAERWRGCPRRCRTHSPGGCRSAGAEAPGPTRPADAGPPRPARESGGGEEAWGLRRVRGLVAGGPFAKGAPTPGGQDALGIPDPDVSAVLPALAKELQKGRGLPLLAERSAGLAGAGHGDAVPSGRSLRASRPPGTKKQAFNLQAEPAGESRSGRKGLGTPAAAIQEEDDPGLRQGTVTFWTCGPHSHLHPPSPYSV